MNTRLGIRVSEKLRAELNEAVQSEEFKNISELLRKLAEEYLEKSKRKRHPKTGIREKSGELQR